MYIQLSIQPDSYMYGTFAYLSACESCECKGVVTAFWGHSVLLGRLENKQKMTAVLTDTQGAVGDIKGINKLRYLKRTIPREWKGDMSPVMERCKNDPHG